jgi:hypothetical protein
MSYQFDFDSTNRILRGRLNGRVTDEVLKDYYRAVAKHAAEIDPRGGITDLSAVTSFEVSADTLRELAGSTPADVVFGMARLFQSEGEDTRPQNHVVRTLRQAWAVLGVHDPKFDALPIRRNGVTR